MDRLIKYSVTSAFVGFLVWVFLVYMSGLDMTVRSVQTAIIYFVSLFFALIGATCFAFIKICFGKG